jgi:hypothetical protein
MFGCHMDLTNEMISKRLTVLRTEINFIQDQFLKFPIEMMVPIPRQPHTLDMVPQLNSMIL